ncbi:MAG: substrate-binding domain-containing protein [Acidimicrobiia bacterium]|nr:substrate-binding domain-containing protein [Acidimicrobiia bacterium]
MRRVLAVVAAAAMVVGSLALRSRLDRDEVESSQVLRLTCATELKLPCEAMESGDARIELTIEAAGTTADRLATTEGDLGLDGWLTTAPWPVIVDQQRQATSLPPLFAAPGPTIARSPLVLAVWKDRAGVLNSRCGGSVGWKCLGEAAGTPGGWKTIGGQESWGPVKLGHAPPASDGIGLLVLGQAAGGWFGRTDLASIDLEDEGFQGWFANLERAVRASAGSPLETMLVTGRSTYDAAATTEAEAGPLLSRSARGSEVDLLYPSPMATADVVLASPTGDADAPAALRREVQGSDGAEALAAAGWRVPGQEPADGVPDTPALPDNSGLPSPGLLDALRTRWHEVTGK